MIETIIARQSMRARHEQSPLLREREQYLTHLAQHGTNHRQLQSVAASLLNVIHFMELSELRSVNRDEIQKAVQPKDKKNHTRQVTGDRRRGLHNRFSFALVRI